MKGNVALGNSLGSLAHSKGEIDEVHLSFAAELKRVKSYVVPLPPPPKKKIKIEIKR